MKFCLFEALAVAEGHAGVEIPDVPAIGDRHVAGIGPAVDEDDAVFAKQTVGTGIVDEAGDEEFLLRPLREISADRGAIVDPGEPDAGMRTARPHDHAEIRSRRRCRRPARPAGQPDNCARVTDVVAGISSPSIPDSSPMQLVAVEIANADAAD